MLCRLTGALSLSSSCTALHNAYSAYGCDAEYLKEAIGSATVESWIDSESIYSKPAMRSRLYGCELHHHNPNSGTCSADSLL